MVDKNPWQKLPKNPTKNPHQKSQTKIAGYTITRYFHNSFFLYIYKNPKKKHIYPKKQKKSCKSRIRIDSQPLSYQKSCKNRVPMTFPTKNDVPNLYVILE
jgi:hypothetical protein